MSFWAFFIIYDLTKQLNFGKQTFFHPYQLPAFGLSKLSTYNSENICRVQKFYFHNNRVTYKLRHKKQSNVVYKLLTFIQRLVPKSANYSAHSAIANPPISEVCQSANRKSTNPQIPNLQSSLVSQSENRKSANLQGIIIISDHDQHWLPLKIFFFIYST